MNSVHNSTDQENNNPYPIPSNQHQPYNPTEPYNPTMAYPSPSSTPQSVDPTPPPYPYPPQGNTYYCKPYNQQLPPTNTTGIPPNISINEAIQAVEAVNSAIHQNGRTPITVVCPTCKTIGLTNIVEIKNENLVQGQSNVMKLFCGSILAVFIFVFIVTTVVSGSYIPLAFMSVVLIFIGVGIFIMRFASKATTNICADVQHYCSSCKVLLGVSSGAQFAQQMQIQNRRTRFNNY